MARLASQIEEPFRLTFQADSIHSGSISFGRFETEVLCWERRSSFSHNKYLEEVEKFSKPGSVTEKKAYFEAHFKKKALESQSSLLSQNETDYNISVNEMSENVGFPEEFEHVHESSHIVGCKEGNDDSIEDQELQPKSLPSHVSGSGDTVNRINENVMTEKGCECETETVLLRNSSVEAKAKDNLSGDCNAEYSDVSSKTILSSGNNTSERDDSVTSNHQPIPPAKVKIGCQSVCDSGKATSPKFVVQTKKKMISKATNQFAKRPSHRQNDSSIRDKSGYQVAEASTKTIVKHEVSHNAKAKLLQQSGSGENFRTKKAVLSRPSTSEKVDCRAHDVPNSCRRSFSSEKLVKTQNCASSSKSNERAEHRKEEKLARDSKQLGKSLNFKATPLPSFYNERERPQKSKALVNNNIKLVKVWNNSPIPPVGVSASVHSKNSLRLPVVTTAQTVKPNRISKSSDQPGSHRQINKKEVKGELKHVSPRKQRASEGIRPSQGQNRVGAEKGRSYDSRNDSRDIHLRSHSITRNLAVGVTS